jgi:hypothetical protein
MIRQCGYSFTFRFLEARGCLMSDSEDIKAFISAELRVQSDLSAEFGV